jgi:predicted RNase H-like nuclease
MPWLAGVDGCRAGWLVVLAQYASSAVTLRDVQLCSRFDDVLALQPLPDVIAVDIPIGLLDEPRSGGRDCDRQARHLLGRRACSVFTPPCRRILQATHYDQVRGYGLSRQAFGILPKIREVDRLMTPAWQKLVYEAHPELAFLSLTGAPLQLNKKTVAGRTARLQALRKLPSTLLRNVKPVLHQALKTFKLWYTPRIASPGIGQAEPRAIRRTTRADYKWQFGTEFLVIFSLRQKAVALQCLLTLVPHRDEGEGARPDSGRPAPPSYTNSSCQGNAYG